MARNVRAGGAFVEISARTEKLLQAIKNAQKRLEDFAKAADNAGKSVRDAGLKVAAFGTVAIGAAAAAVAAFTKVAGDFSDLAAQTGLTVEIMSELETALKDAGTSVEDFAKSNVKLARFVQEARDGTKANVEALRALGIEVSDLDGLSPDELFLRFADAIAAIKDPTKQTAVAMELFGKTGYKLLPVLRQGSAGIGKFREEAKFLGLSIKGDVADSADALGTQMEILKDQILRAVVAIGEGLAPAFGEIVAVLQGAVAGVTRWIRENRELFAVALRVGAALAVAGTAIAAIGTAIIGVGIAVKVIAAAFAGLAAIVGVIAAPATLVVGALLALGAAGLYASGVFGYLAKSVQDAFGFISEYTSQTFGGIADALAAGEIQLAAEIAMKGLRIAFTEGFNWIFANVVSPFMERVGDILSNIPGLSNTGRLLAAAARQGKKISTTATDDRKELEDLNRQAREARDIRDRQRQGPLAPVLDEPPEFVSPEIILPDADIEIPALEEQAAELDRRTSALGGFNATALAGIVGEVDAQEQIAKNTAAMLEQLRAIFREVRDGGLVFS